MGGQFIPRRLLITGCDSVDTLVARVGSERKAEALVHSMIINWIHFDDMRKDKKAMQNEELKRARAALGASRVDLAIAASKGASGSSLMNRVAHLGALEHEYERLEQKVKGLPPCDYCGTMPHDLDCPLRNE